MRRRVPRGAWVALAVLTMLCAAALVVLSQTGDDRAATAPPPSAPEQRPDLVEPLQVEAAAEVAAPTRVMIPGIDVDSSLEELRTDERGRLASPVEWQQAGWFADGVAPGATGPAVVAGHVDSPTGPAVFAELGQLQPGDPIEVERRDGSTVTFEVDRSEVVGKDDFPTDAVYGPTPDAQLRLITCDGAHVRSSGGYQENLVVWATAVDL